MDTLLSILMVPVFFIGGFFGMTPPQEETNLGLPIITVPQGGTGAASFTLGECLVGNGTGAITTDPCGSGGGSGNVSTSTSETAGSLAYWTSTGATPALLGQVATGTLSATSPITVTAGRSVVGGSATVAFDSTAVTTLTNLVISASQISGILGVPSGGTGRSSHTANSLLVGDGNNAINSVATTTLTASSPLSLSNPVAKVGGSNSVLTLDTSGAWSGTAALATALAANGANCSAGNYPLGVDASGAVEGCTAAGGSSFAYPFPGNATSTSLDLNGGLSTTELNVVTGATITGLVLTDVTGSTQCLQADSSGNITGTGSACGSGGFSYPFPSNATTTQIAFNGGLTAVGATTTALAVTGSTTISSVLNVGGQINANGGVVGNLTGTASLATALAANGANCSAGSYPLGVDASGAVETCTADAIVTAGDALTVTGTDIDFDGGATPAGDLGGTWASPSVTDNSHAHDSTTISGLGTADISGLDISDDTNLAGTWPIILTGDTLSFGGLSTSTAAVIGNIPYFSGVNTFANVATGTASCTTGVSCTSFSVIGSSPSITATLGTSIAASEFADGDWGDLTASGGSVTIDANSVALTTDTTGNYVEDVTGTANQITATTCSGAEDANCGLAIAADFRPASTTLTGNTLLTSATTTNLAVLGGLTFNGVTGTTWAAFCTTITGSAALCDGDDATGGGASFAYPFPSNATTTLIDFQGGLKSASTTLTGPFVFANATGTNATTTNFFATTASSTNLYGANLSACQTGSFLTWASGLFGCDTDDNTTYTAGDALTLTGTDFDFDGGATPSGDVGGTWASITVTDDSHAHTGATLSGIDISDDTNLTAGDALTITGDDIDFDGGTAPSGELGGTWSAITIDDGVTVNNWALGTIASGIGTALTALNGENIQDDTIDDDSIDFTDVTLADITFDVGSVDTTEFGYLNGVTSAIQTQLSLLGTIAGQVWTGVHDFGGAVFELTNGTAPTVDATGELALDTTSGNLILATSTNAGGFVVASATTSLYAFSVASTSPDFVSGGIIDLPSHFLPQVVTAIWCKVDSGTSQQIFISDGTNDTNTITCTTTGTQFAITTNNTWTAYEAIRVEFVTKSGTPDYITIRAMGYRTSD